MVTRKPIPPPDPGCTDFLQCLLTNPDPAALALLAAAGSLVLFALVAAAAHIADARSLLERERERVGDEAEAFDAFAARVAEMEVPGPQVTADAPGGMAALEAAPPDTRLQAVRDAYRDTVMSVPHYEAEYGESLQTNMAIEFGQDVAGAVDRGTALTPQLQGTLVERSSTARRQRTELLEQLDGEADALDAAEADLRAARRSAERIEDAPLDDYTFEELSAEWYLLADREEETEAVLADRQETVQSRDRRASVRNGGPSLEEYLYDPLEVTHPVLAEGTALLERVGRARQRVERALASGR